MLPLLLTVAPALALALRMVPVALPAMTWSESVPDDAPLTETPPGGKMPRDESVPVPLRAR